MPTDVEEVDAEHIRAFILSEERRTSAASAAVHFRNLRVYFGWLAREGAPRHLLRHALDRLG